MTIYRCVNCGKSYVAAPPVCRCGGEEFRAEEGPASGRVYSCTTLHAAAEPFEKDLPFQIAIVELDDGPRLTARIAGSKVDIGDPVRFLELRDGVAFFSAG